jgi:hypothetical protein
VVYGPPGSGKTYLMATAVDNIKVLPFFIFGISVRDPDPVGSGPFCEVRIRKFFTGSGSGSDPLKVLIIIRKGDFFSTTFLVQVL